METTAYLTAREVAEDLAVSRMTVNRWCHDGTLPAYRYGHRWRIDRADYELFKTRARAASS